MRNLQPMFSHIEFESISCRGLKEAPGGVSPIEIDGGGVTVLQNRTVFMNGVIREEAGTDANNSTSNAEIANVKDKEDIDVNDSKETDQSPTIVNTTSSASEAKSPMDDTVLDESSINMMEEEHSNQNQMKVEASDVNENMTDKGKEELRAIRDEFEGEATSDSAETIDASKNMSDGNLENNEMHIDDAQHDPIDGAENQEYELEYERDAK